MCLSDLLIFVGSLSVTLHHPIQQLVHFTMETFPPVMTCSTQFPELGAIKPTQPTTQEPSLNQALDAEIWESWLDTEEEEFMLQRKKRKLPAPATSSPPLLPLPLFLLLLVVFL